MKSSKLNHQQTNLPSFRTLNPVDLIDQKPSHPRNITKFHDSSSFSSEKQFSNNSTYGIVQKQNYIEEKNNFKIVSIIRNFHVKRVMLSSNALIFYRIRKKVNFFIMILYTILEISKGMKIKIVKFMNMNLYRKMKMII